MRRAAAILAALALALSLCACGGEEAETPALLLYSPAPWTESAPSLRAVETEGYYGPSTVDGLLSAEVDILFSGGVALEGWELSGSLLRVELSDAYAAIPAVDRTLAQCCIVLALCQLEAVERVQVTARGLDGPAPYLAEDDILFTGAEEEPRQVTVALYFPRSSGRGLGFELRELTLTEDDDLYVSVTRALLAGPESGDLRSPFPEGLEVLAAKLEGGVCHVDFSAELVEGITGDDAERDLLLYSIVDTLGNLDSVVSVQLLAEGEPLKVYGTTDASLPLAPNFGLLTD